MEFFCGAEGGGGSLNAVARLKMKFIILWDQKITRFIKACHTAIS